MHYQSFAWCTVLLIASTGVFSFLAFRDSSLERKYIFNPESILAYKQYYRLVTPAFLHAGWSHLFWNMFSLYSFGPLLELRYGWWQFLLIYFGSVVGGNLLALFVHRHHHYFAYGASGGVCGVIFAFILLFPGGGVGFFLPIAIPGWLYAIAFIALSFFGMRQNRDNIGHDAHLGGAIVGLLIAAALHPSAVSRNALVFLIVLVSAAILLGYLWINPHLLPVGTVFSRPFLNKPVKSSPPPFTREAFQIDSILDKISKSGVESLTPEEKSYLDDVSGKYRRRADSKKPESGLTI